MVQTCCEAVKSLKNHKKMVRNTKIRCPKLPELKDLKKSHWITPGSAFTCKYPYGAPQAYKSGGGDVWILVFWPKTISFHMVMHKKATITLWFAKKTQVESVFFLILGHFGVI